jgi:hypothetical protein
MCASGMSQPLSVHFTEQKKYMRAFQNSGIALSKGYGYGFLVKRHIALCEVSFVQR